MKRSGFTMIELVFSVVMIGILATIAASRFVTTRTDAQVATARSDMASAQKMIVSKVFADNIDPTASRAPRPENKASNMTNSMTWGDWILEVSGLAGLNTARWATGGAPITNPRTILSENGITPISYSGTATGSSVNNCGMMLGIHPGTGTMLFAPNNLNKNGLYCQQLEASYKNSSDVGNRIVVLSSSSTLTFY